MNREGGLETPQAKHRDAGWLFWAVGKADRCKRTRGQGAGCFCSSSSSVCAYKIRCCVAHRKQKATRT